MDIDQNKHRQRLTAATTEMRKVISHDICPKSQKQQIQLAKSTETNLNSLVAKASSGSDGCMEVKKKAEEPKECF